MKLSLYTIITKVENDLSIYYSTISGKFLVLNSIMNKAIKEKEYSLLPQNLYNLLIDYEMLVKKYINELKKIIKENNDNLYISFIPSSNCQLGCSYCGQSHDNSKYEKSDNEIIYNYFENKILTSNYKSVSVGWFGGEPLINLKSIEYLSHKFKNLCSKNNITYEAKTATNGILLNIRNFSKLMNCSINYIDITLDGTSEFHDNSRYFKNKNKSFEIIYTNLVKISNEKDLIGDCQLNIRMNVHKKNIKSVLTLYGKLKKDKMLKCFNFYIVPVHAWGNDANKITPDYDEFSELEMLLLKTSIKDYNKGTILPDRNFEVCMAVNPNAELIDPNGNIFSCTELPLVNSYNTKDIILGNIFTNTITKNKRLYGDWYLKLEKDNTNSPCFTCNLLPVCGGLCPKNWEENKGNCPSFKYNIKERIKLAYSQIVL